MTAPVALITGASSGIGRETALQLAAKGWRLALPARREDRLKELADAIQAAGGPAPLVLPGDIAQPGAAAARVEKTAAHFGRLDVLINNAGILRMSNFLQMPLSEMRDVFETNFWATVETVRAAVPILERQGGGRVVQIGSGVSRRGLPFMGAYSASKFALLGLTESLRVELAAKGISFSLVLPGGTDTEMPANVDRSRLPPGYPHREGYRVSAARAARTVVKAVERGGAEYFVPWWVRPAAWVSALWPRFADFLVKKGYRTIQWK